MALLIPTPQVIAMRLAAMEGACGPRTAFIPSQANDVELANSLVGYFLSQDGQSRLLPSVRLDILRVNLTGGPIKPIRMTPALVVHLDDVNRRRFFHRWKRAIYQR